MYATIVSRVALQIESTEGYQNGVTTEFNYQPRGVHAGGVEWGRGGGGGSRKIENSAVTTNSFPERYDNKQEVEVWGAYAKTNPIRPWIYKKKRRQTQQELAGGTSRKHVNGAPKPHGRIVPRYATKCVKKND